MSPLAVFAAFAVGSALPLRAQTPHPPSELHVAAAADLQPVLPQLASAFEKDTGTHITSTFGSSATLTQQIQNGLPADIFLSADCTHPQALADAHLAVIPVQYATGTLVLWARKESPLQPLRLESLRSPRLTHLAVANDRHAPYGQAATAELKALGLDALLAPKLVVGENILQTAQFADSGNAEAGLISLTIASSPHFRESGSYITLPQKYPAIRQCGAVLQHAANNHAASAFLAWLTSPAIQAHLPPLGLQPANDSK